MPVPYSLVVKKALTPLSVSAKPPKVQGIFRGESAACGGTSARNGPLGTAPDAEGPSQTRAGCTLGGCRSLVVGDFEARLAEAVNQVLDEFWFPRLAKLLARR